VSTTTSEFTLTDDERALLPTDEEIRAYAEHGWYLSRKQKVLRAEIGRASCRERV